MTRYFPGDIVARRKGLVMHKGLVLRDGRILHNTPFRGEHVATEAEFRAGKRLSVRRSEDAARARALSHDATAPGRHYNLLTNNCEHTVHRVTSGRAHSPQLRGWVAGVGLAALAFALTRRPGVAAAGYAVGRRLGDALGRTLARDRR